MTETPTPASGPEVVPIVHYADQREAFEEALVALAIGEDCQVDAGPAGGFVLLAHPERATRILGELEEYRTEEAQPKRRDMPQPVYGSGPLLTLAWVLAESASFWMQHESDTWEARGILDPAAVLDHGEWWRPFTALFLHANIGHLLGNLVSGVLFFTWACRALGPMRAWPLILVSGAAGNYLNAMVHYHEPFQSLGASTAVFGALGLLTGNGLHHSLGGGMGRMLAKRLLPLGAGLALLLLTGMGPEPGTDVTAHMFGFGAGLVLGYAATLVPHRVKSLPALSRS